MAPELPSKIEPATILFPAEPKSILWEDYGSQTEQIPNVSEIHMSYLDPDTIEKTNEISIQCDDLEEEIKIEESKILLSPLPVIEEEPSDEDNFSIHSFDAKPNKVTVGIQTNDAHFRNIERTEEF